MAIDSDQAQPDPSLRARLIEELALPDGDVVAALVEFKNTGGKMHVAYATLATMRDDSNEARDDQVTDVMDLVSGWCSPDLWIWCDVEYPIQPTELEGAPATHQLIVEWSKANDVSWCLTREGYRFKTAADAVRFVTEWKRIASELEKLGAE
jgi:hypothetical protein